MALKRWPALALALLVVAGLGSGAFAQEAAPAAETTVAPQASAADTASDVLSGVGPAPRMTVADMMRAGGVILWVIGAISVIGLALGVYCLFTITPAREVPPMLIKRVHGQIVAGEIREAYRMCEGRDELFARVLQAGLKMHGHDRYVIQEAMESEGERGATALWQRISYLNNVGTIAPLLGLLGTVWGMMNAFGSIAYDDSQVKTIEVANGVAQAMVTTAAGLIVAIPAMICYYYLRGRVLRVISEVESQATEAIELLARRES